jgi:2-phosphoglycolate phosphatase
MAQYQAVLFDLDGTLVDTAPDLGYALNSLLEQEGLASLPHDLIRPVASNGSAGLLSLGFGLTTDDAEFKPLQARFIRLYQDNIARGSRLFPGMSEVLDYLEQSDIIWGIVTNKPAFLTDPLAILLNLTERAACIVSGDTTPHAKPHPAPMLHACHIISVEPEKCLYVGDAARDIEAGKNAHMTTILARYGYISADDDANAWQADGSIDHPAELLKWL